MKSQTDREKSAGRRVRFGNLPKGSLLKRVAPAASQSDTVGAAAAPESHTGSSCTSILLVAVVIFCCLCVSFLVPYAVLCEGSAFGISGTAEWHGTFCGAVQPAMLRFRSSVSSVEAQWNAFMLRLELDTADVTPVRRLGLLPPSLALSGGGGDTHLYSVASMRSEHRPAQHMAVQQLLRGVPASLAALQGAMDGARAKAARGGVFPYSSGGGVWCPVPSAPTNTSTWCSSGGHTGDLDTLGQLQACGGDTPVSASKALGRSTYDELCKQLDQQASETVQISVDGDAVSAGAAAPPDSAGTLKCRAREARDAVLGPLLDIAATDLYQEAAWVARGIAPLPSVQATAEEAEARLLLQSSATRHHLWAATGEALTPLHYDMEHNTYTQLAGSKLWLLLPPAAWRVVGGHPSGHHAWRQAAAQWAANHTVFSHCAVGASDGLLPVCLHADGASAPHIRCSACDGGAPGQWPAFLALLVPGSTLAVPPMWYHAVLSRQHDSAASVAVNSWAPELALAEAQAALAEQGPPLRVQPHTDVPGVATVLRSYVWSTLQALLAPVRATAKRYLQQRRKWATHNPAADGEGMGAGTAHSASLVWRDMQRLMHLTPQCLVGWLWIARWHVPRRGVWRGHGACSDEACGKPGDMPSLQSCDDVQAYLQRLAAAESYLPAAGSPWQNVLGSNPAQDTLRALKDHSAAHGIGKDFVRSVQATGMALFSVLPSDVRQQGGPAGDRRSGFLSTAQATHLSNNAASLARGWAIVESLFGDHLEELVAGVVGMHLPLAPAGLSRLYPGTDARGGAEWLTMQQADSVHASQGMPLRTVPQPVRECGEGGSHSAPRGAALPEAAQLFWHVLVLPQL